MYGIPGLRYPIVNDRIQTDIENRFCGDVAHTCCSREDLSTIREIWANARN
jgi:hypothetical protein